MAKKNQLTSSDYLEYSEYEKLLVCLHKDEEYMWELYARLAFCTACRASDVLTLKWSDVLNKKFSLITEKKTKKTRGITFNDSVVKKLNELYCLVGSPEVNSLIFKTNRSKAGFTIQYVNRKLKDFKFKYKINIENFSTHTFRKTFGRYVYETNNKSAESLILLNNILNHSSLTVTKVYIGITKDEISNIYNSIKF